MIPANKNSVIYHDHTKSKKYPKMGHFSAPLHVRARPRWLQVGSTLYKGASSRPLAGAAGKGLGKSTKLPDCFFYPFSAPGNP